MLLPIPRRGNIYVSAEDFLNPWVKIRWIGRVKTRERHGVDFVWMDGIGGMGGVRCRDGCMAITEMSPCKERVKMNRDLDRGSRSLEKQKDQDGRNGNMNV